MHKDALVNRELATLEEALQEIDDVFVFNPPQTSDNQAKCEALQLHCKGLARFIAKIVPPGKEQTIAINNLLSTALFACHGVLKRQVVVMAVTSCPDQPPASGTGG